MSSITKTMNERKRIIKFFAKCECGKSELTKKELKESKKNGCIMCDKCFMPKIIEKIEVKNE